MLFRKNKDLFGLDIGSHSIKLVEIKQVRKDYTLKTFGIKHLPKDVIVDGAVMDLVALGETIREVVAEAKPSSKYVAVAVSGQGVIVKKISIPVVTEEELASSIQWETEQYLQFNIQDVYVDFRILGESPDFPGQMDVILAAAKRDVVNDYLNIIREAGLEPIVVDVAVFALQNMAEMNYQFAPDEVALLCNLGASFSNLNIIKNGRSLFTRDVNLGGNRISEELQKSLAVTFDEAEQIKLSGGGGDVQAKSIIDSEIDNIANEIKRTVDFFIAANPQDGITRIILFGGTSQLAGLPAALREKVGIDVLVGNPMSAFSKNAKLTEAPGFSASELGVSIGLAIRRLGDK